MDDIDFSLLASQDADFAKILKSNGQLDFSDPEAVFQLTKSLLKQHFNLKIELPSDRLCPPVPNRFNYIKWIQELLDTTGPSYSDIYEPDREVFGLDIGTGASCIYPLLGCASRPNWKFIGTDIDDKSFSYAQKNVSINDLNSRIRLLKTENDGPLVPLDLLDIKSIDFTICNPPFYPSTTSLLSSAAQKSRPPSTACTGSPSEMIYPGGEVAFLTKLIDESLILKERVQWYSSMIGKLDSLKELLVILKEKSITNIAIKELIQGSKTRRWALAWSFHSIRPPVNISRGISASSGIPKQYLPFPSEFTFFTKSTPTPTHETLIKILTNLSISINHTSSPYIITGFTPGNTWSRASRRKTTKDAKEGKGDDFGFRIMVGEGGEGMEVVVRWLKGFDSVVFESFCGMVRRKFVEG